MEARVKAQQDGQWHDPHNKGVYSVTDSSTPGVLDLDREQLRSEPFAQRRIYPELTRMNNSSAMPRQT